MKNEWGNNFASEKDISIVIGSRLFYCFSTWNRHFYIQPKITKTGILCPGIMPSDRVIPKALMIKYYSKFLEELKDEEEKSIEKTEKE